MINILTVDLEDWYQSSTEIFNVERETNEIIYPTEMVIVNTEKLLYLFDSYNVHATFFVLGSVAEMFPALIEKVKAGGHEIASHGYSHKLIYKMSKEEFRQDLRKSIKVIENITKEKVLGFRAPYFSIREDSMWAIDVLKEEGLKYDSSIFPLKRRLYGVSDLSAVKINGIIEFPASKTDLLGYKFPFGGGGYLRLFPYALTKWAIRRINKQAKPAMIYLHPYEIDTTDHNDYGIKNDLFVNLVRFTQGINRGKTENKISQLLKDFKFTSIKKYLEAKC